jgi:hypothetical protein
MQRDKYTIENRNGTLISVYFPYNFYRLLFIFIFCKYKPVVDNDIRGQVGMGGRDSDTYSGDVPFESRLGH